MRVAISIALLLTASGLARAQQPLGTMMGAGMMSCAEFGFQHRQPSTPELGFFYFSWAQGFMSGLNVTELALNRPMRNLNAMPVADQQKAIQKLCDERPHLTVAEVVRDFYQTLPLIPPPPK